MRIVSLALMAFVLIISTDANAARGDCREFRETKRQLINDIRTFEQQVDAAVNDLRVAARNVRATEQNRQGPRRTDALRNAARTVRVAYRKLDDALTSLDLVETELAVVDATIESFCQRGAGGRGPGGQAGKTIWSSNYGDMELPRSPGGYVEAYYDDGKFITGTFQNGRLAGYWFHENVNGRCAKVRGTTNWGRFVFDFNDQYTRFDGRWAYCHTQRLDKEWDGQRR